MYQALYRKYRPANFGDVKGQEHITKTLTGQLKMGNISHAYLFTGPRGTGKTSCAKIFAKAVNCLNPKEGDACCECEACLSIAGVSGEENVDITEIDAASNNGVDNIRELRSSVNYTPIYSKYKVYIIDEVHMLSAGAFNALLKTLEEPPSHVIFILATTEIHKLPATIISRCQRFDFKRISNETISNRLIEVAEKEGFQIEKSAASLIAGLSDGGMRDALGMLDLCAASGLKIDEDRVLSCCAVAGNERIFDLTESIINKASGDALEKANALWRDSVDMARLSEELINHFRNLMVMKTAKNPESLIFCSTEELAQYKKQSELLGIEFIMTAIRLLGETMTRMNSSNRKAELEMALIKLCDTTLIEEKEGLLARIESLERKLEGRVLVAPQQSALIAEVPIKVNAKVPTDKREETEEIPLPSEEDIPEDDMEISSPAVPIKKTEVKIESADGEIKLDCWKDILKELLKPCPLLVGVLKNSDAYQKGDYLLIDCQNEQFLSLIKQNLYRDALKKAAFGVTGKNYKLGPYKSSAKKSVDVLGSITGKLGSLGVNESE